MSPSEQFSSVLGAKQKFDNCKEEQNSCYQTIWNETNASIVLHRLVGCVFDVVSDFLPF